MNKLVLRHELYLRVVSIWDVNEMLEMKRCNNKWREVLVVFISVKPWYKYECTKWGKEKGKCVPNEKTSKVVSSTSLFWPIKYISMVLNKCVVRIFKLKMKFIFCKIYLMQHLLMNQTFGYYNEISLTIIFSTLCT